MELRTRKLVDRCLSPKKLGTKHGLFILLFINREVYMKELGEYLKRTRISNGVSIAEAAEDLELSTSQIENIERSAQTWASNHVFELPSDNGEFIILTLGQLKEEGLYLSASDSDISIRTFIPKEEITEIVSTGSVVISGKYIVEIIKKLPDKDIVIDVKVKGLNDVKELNKNIPSIRRNPILADIFARMKFMDRRGSGFDKIINGTNRLFNDNENHVEFYATTTHFSVVIYNANFNDDFEIAGDITKIDEKDIPAFDICLAGFPCQAFSLAGQRMGFDDNYKGMCRGTLFMDVARICEYHKPKVIFCENVKGLVIHDRGRTFKIICNCLQSSAKYAII